MFCFDQMHDFVIFSFHLLNLVFRLVWSEHIFVCFYHFCYIEWLSWHYFFLIFDSRNCLFYKTFYKLQKICCILLNFNKKTQMFENSEYIINFFNSFCICFFSWSVSDCFSYSDIRIKKCLYWLVIRNFVQLSHYLTVYQLIMNC